MTKNISGCFRTSWECYVDDALDITLDSFLPILILIIYIIMAESSSRDRYVDFVSLPHDDEEARQISHRKFKKRNMCFDADAESKCARSCRTRIRFAQRNTPE
jgi:hypothetical protein